MDEVTMFDKVCKVLIASKIVPTATKEHPCGMDAAESCQHLIDLVKQLQAEVDRLKKELAKVEGKLTYTELERRYNKSQTDLRLLKKEYLENTENQRLRDALEKIKARPEQRYDWPDNSNATYGEYSKGITDGVRLCITIAKQALERGK